MLLVALSINLGHYARDSALFGNPLGPGQEDPTQQAETRFEAGFLLPGDAGADLRYANNLFTLRSLFSNVLRNVALHLYTPFRRTRAWTEAGVRWLHSVVGIDIDDPRTTGEPTSI